MWHWLIRCRHPAGRLDLALAPDLPERVASEDDADPLPEQGKHVQCRASARLQPGHRFPSLARSGARASSFGGRRAMPPVVSRCVLAGARAACRCPSIMSTCERRRTPIVRCSSFAVDINAREEGRGLPMLNASAIAPHSRAAALILRRASPGFSIPHCIPSPFLSSPMTRALHER